MQPKREFIFPDTSGCGHFRLDRTATTNVSVSVVYTTIFVEVSNSSCMYWAFTLPTRFCPMPSCHDVDTSHGHPTTISHITNLRSSYTFVTTCLCIVALLFALCLLAVTTRVAIDATKPSTGRLSYCRLHFPELQWCLFHACCDIGRLYQRFNKSWSN